jgi:hypothetical protein
VSFGNYVTAQCVARGYSGRLLQIVQAVAAFPDGCFQYAKTMAKGLPLGRQGKPAHQQTIYRAFREHPELFERKRLKPGAVPSGGGFKLPNGGGHTRVRLDFLGIEKPRSAPTPRRGFNVNRQSSSTQPPRRLSVQPAPFPPRAAVEPLPPDELEHVLATFQAALGNAPTREFDPDLVARPGADPPE